MTDSLAGLSRAIQQFADERDWGQFHSPKNLASALIVEAGELLEHFQWLTDGQSRSLAPPERDAVADEAADVLIYLIQFANSANIDLLAAAHRKLQVNIGRFPVERVRGSALRGDYNGDADRTEPTERADRIDRGGRSDRGDGSDKDTR